MYSIVFSISNNYAKFCAVTIASIINATNAKYGGGANSTKSFHNRALKNL